MRNNFESIIGGYSEESKESIKPENLTKEGRAEFKSHLTEQFEANSKERATTPEVQEEIFKLQKKKQELILKLHKQFKKIESGETIEKEGSWRVLYDQDTGLFSHKNDRGETVQFTREDLLTDGEWGISYALDASVPMNIRKEYVFTETKREISALLDDQIIMDEVGSMYTDDFKKNAYNAIEKRKSEEMHQSGIIAEKMVKNVLKKIALKSGSVFEIEDANVYQDVEQKIDFIVKRKRRARAVGVEEDSKTVGIQFTLNKEKVALKERQIDRAKKHLHDDEEVEDILLVSTEMGYAKRIYDLWAKNKRPGGPEKHISESDSQKILSEVMRDIMTEEEIRGILG